MKIKQILVGIVLAILPLLSIAAANMTNVSINNAVQSIQVVNLLGNTDLVDPGMTITPIMVKYFNGNSSPCWVTVLNFQEDTTVHAGPMLGCVNKITELVIEPVIVANKLRTYYPQLTVPIDVTKYSHQVTVIQDDSPTFDAQSGLITKSGSMKVKIQSLYRS